MTHTEIFTLLRFARAYSAEKLPWFAPALFRCRLCLTEAVPVAAISVNMDIYFNPRAVAVIAASGTKEEVLAQLAFLWVHEISHILREHAERATEFNADAQLWNIAADLEINDSQWQGLTPPKAFKGVFPKDFKLPEGQITEWYYRKLLDKSNSTKSSSTKGFADEGSGVHGQLRPWEITGHESEASSNPQELTELQKEIIRRGVAHEISMAKTQGNMPAGWQRWADEKLHPQINWRQVLKKRMTVAIAQGLGMRIDYSYARPSRRQSTYNPILPPSLSGNMEPRVACVIDTSGSMSDAYISQALAEVFAILETFHIPVTLIPCDAEAYQPITVAKPSDRFKVTQLQGGGGTDMVAGITAALNLTPPPDTVLVLTDGYTNYPPTPYKTRVIFGIIKESLQHTTPLPNMPPWTKDTVLDIIL
ncbi:hypothetical protein C7N43_37760 [Sphingobacteriales bacterium UPWRP_1]|nr:hypothetical protein C7N43_37760 [Sphingobacteriales bacterium UPWRP_1]